MRTAIEGIYQCSRCKGIFTEDEMHNNRSRSLQVCKSCHNINERERRAASRERQREYQRNYYKSNCNTAKETARVNRLIYPEKHSAMDKVKYSVKRGVLSQQPCEVCRCHNAQAHHDDYSKPLEVRWLCPLHHQELHSKMKEELLK